jgi:hypothetical protein
MAAQGVTEKVYDLLTGMPYEDGVDEDDAITELADILQPVRDADSDYIEDFDTDEIPARRDLLRALTEWADKYLAPMSTEDRNRMQNDIEFLAEAWMNLDGAVNDLSHIIHYEDPRDYDGRAADDLRSNGAVHEDDYESPNTLTYGEHQRIDDQAPYGEHQVSYTFADRNSHTHFNNDRLQAHARTEQHGNTTFIIEGQSQFGADNRYKNTALNPFMATKHWTRLSVASGLVQAVDQGSSWLAWPSASNRHMHASLDPRAGKVTYEQGFPDAVRFIWKQMGFGQPDIEPTPNGNGFRVRLTDQMRAALKLKGIPVLGVAGLLLGGAGTDATRTAMRKRRGPVGLMQ